MLAEKTHLMGFGSALQFVTDFKNILLFSFRAHLLFSAMSYFQLRVVEVMFARWKLMLLHSPVWNQRLRISIFFPKWFE